MSSSLRRREVAAAKPQRATARFDNAARGPYRPGSTDKASMSSQAAAGADIDTVAGLESLARSYDVIFCDVWGVLHNGITAFAGASEALTRYRAGGGRVVLISNAPRPGAALAPQLDRIGVPRTAYDAILTSGDLTRAAVIERLGKVVHHLGPERDLAIFEGLAVRFGTIQEADYVVCSGFHNDDVETVEDYAEALAAMRARSLWMLCANPDMVVERGDRLVPCAGALATAYEEIGGEVYWAGKPHRPVYDAALALSARFLASDTVPLERVLAVGDALRTDIAGAAALGIDSLLVARGIHAGELGLQDGPLDRCRVGLWLAEQEVRPAALMDTLTW
jgi:HAD superfamily hydrolase (TIGR01459 family)